MSLETILTNARVVTADAEFDGTVVVRDGRIAEIATERSHAAGALDLEALAAASPDTLSDDDVVNLHRSIRHALRASITASKDELAWRYQNRGAPSPFQVYDRGGEPCLRCGAPLATTTVAGRTTVLCPTCQALPAV